MGEQILIRIHNGLANDMDDYVGDDKPYSTRQDLIREAIRDKLRMLKVEA